VSAQQRRRWERYRKELDVAIERGDGSHIAGRTQDVCEGGIGVVCVEALEVGSDYRFAIAEIGGTALVGTVRWCTPSAQGANVVGVELTKLTASQTEALADAIVRWKSEDAGFGEA